MILRGLVAGVVTIVGFTGLHHLLISNIWAMLPVMAVAAAATGASLAWTFARLDLAPSLAGWFALTGGYLVLLAVLGVCSLWLFTPVTTFAAVSEASGPVDELIVRALPLSAAWVLVTVLLGAGLDHLRTGRRARGVAPLTVTSVLVLLTLGLNMSVLGLVELEGDARAAMTRFCGLVGLVVVVHALVFAGLLTGPGRRRSSGRPVSC